MIYLAKIKLEYFLAQNFLAIRVSARTCNLLSCYGILDNLLQLEPTLPVHLRNYVANRASVHLSRFVSPRLSKIVSRKSIQNICITPACAPVSCTHALQLACREIGKGIGIPLTSISHIWLCKREARVLTIYVREKFY